MCSELIIVIQDWMCTEFLSESLGLYALVDAIVKMMACRAYQSNCSWKSPLRLALLPSPSWRHGVHLNFLIVWLGFDTVLGVSGKSMAVVNGCCDLYIYA